MADIKEFERFYPQGTSFSNAVSFFEAASHRTANEYLIAFARHAKLVKIVEGKRTGGESKTQWIGDKEAYERFREYEFKARKFPEAGVR